MNMKKKVNKNDRYRSAYIYINEDYYNQPKEQFKYLAEFIIPKMRKDKEYSILDVGCAKGEFLYYIKSRAKFKRIVGIDYSQRLINEAKNFRGLKGVEFYCDFAEYFSINTKFDFILMTGVLGFFEDVQKPLDNLIRHLKKTGVMYITGLFNKYDIDVLVKYRNNKYSKVFENNGNNNHSIETVKRYLRSRRMAITGIYKFKMPFDVERKQDPSRSWVINTEEGQKFINGLGFIFDFTTLEIKFKK